MSQCLPKGKVDDPPLRGVKLVMTQVSEMLSFYLNSDFNRENNDKKLSFEATV